MRKIDLQILLLSVIVNWIFFSDIFSKSSQSIIDILLNNDSFSDEDIINCLHKIANLLFC